MQAIMSQQYKDLLNKGIDPARRLIMDAVQDEQLFEDLLMAEVSGDLTQPLAAPVKRRLNAWLATLAVPDEESEE